MFGMSFRIDVYRGMHPGDFSFGGAPLPDFDGEKPPVLKVRAENLVSSVQASIDEPLELVELDLPIKWNERGEYSLEVNRLVSIILQNVAKNNEFEKLFSDGAVDLRSNAAGHGVEIDSDPYGAGRTFRIPGLGVLVAA